MACAASFEARKSVPAAGATLAAAALITTWERATTMPSTRSTFIRAFGVPSPVAAAAPAEPAPAPTLTPPLALGAGSTGCTDETVVADPTVDGELEAEGAPARA